MVKNIAGPEQSVFQAVIVKASSLNHHGESIASDQGGLLVSYFTLNKTEQI